MTLIDLITEQAARLKQAGVSFGHGTTNAFDEAAWLVLWSLGLDLDALEAKAARRLDDADQRQGDRADRPAHRDPPAGRLPDPRGLAAERAVLHRRAQHRAALVHRRTAGRRRRQRHARRLVVRSHPARARPVHRQRQPGGDRGDGLSGHRGRRRRHRRRRARGRAHQRRPAPARRAHPGCCSPTCSSRSTAATT